MCRLEVLIQTPCVITMSGRCEGGKDQWDGMGSQEGACDAVIKGGGAGVLPLGMPGGRVPKENDE